jgi:hypothetical protein
MSLKAFHVIFITMSILLCLGFGAWCFGSDYAHGKGSYLIVGCGSFVLGAVLVAYEIAFLRKLRNNQ